MSYGFEASPTDRIYTSKGEFTYGYLEDLFFNKQHNLPRVKNKRDLQKVCDNFTKYLDDKGYNLYIYKRNIDKKDNPIVTIRGESFYRNEPYGFSIRKRDKEWVHNYIFLLYDLYVDGYSRFIAFSDLHSEHLEILPTQDAIDYLIVREELVNIASVLNSYKIPSYFFLESTFVDCLEKSWHKLGRHVLSK